MTFVETGWFETEEELDEIQRAFVNVLQAHAEAWPLNPAETCLVLPGDEAYGYPLALGQSPYGRLLVYVDIPAPGENLILLTAGAYLNCDHVTGDELHNQMFTLPAEPTTLRWDIRLPSLSDPASGRTRSRPVPSCEPCGGRGGMTHAASASWPDGAGPDRTAWICLWVVSVVPSGLMRCGR